MKRKLLLTVFLCITFSVYAETYATSSADSTISITELLPPTITSQPEGGTIYVGESIDITVEAVDYTTIQWEFSLDNGSSWSTISDNATFSGSSTTTLSFTPDSELTTGILFRAILTDASNDTVTSSEALVIVDNYTQIPDPNFEARLEALGYDDISGDGQVPTSLIRNVTSLNVDAQNISDLTGIEAFTRLDELRADNNNLTNPDFSQNTVLRRLFLRNNNITVFDLSANTRIQRLLVEGNGMTSLNLTGLTILDNLFAANNNLTEMDLSTNVRLQVVGLGNNDLSRLDIRNGNNTRITIFQTTNNPNLTCVEVDDVAYSTANWTVIDAQTGFTEADCYTQIPDANFEASLEALGYDDISGDGQVPTLLIEPVTSLNVSNQNIADLTGIEGFISLTTLNAGSNSFTSIDLSNNTTLESLSLENASLTSLDLSNNTALEELSLEDTQTLSSVDISANTSLLELDLGNMGISDVIFGNNSNLQTLVLSNNNFTFLDLSGFPALTLVFLANNDLVGVDIQNGNNTAISTFNATNNPNLTCIKVDDVAYSTTNWTDIDAATSFTTTAFCDYTSIPDANFEAELDSLGYDDIAADGQVPTQLIAVVDSLNVSNKAIADLTGIEDFTNLEILIASDNNLTSVNTDNLAQLTKLNLQSNTIGSLDFTNNLLLETVEVGDNSLTSLVITMLANLKTLDISENSISSINLSNNTALEELYANDNQLASVDVTSNTALLNINLNNNSLTDATFKNGNNTNIVSFSITGNSNLDCVFVDDVAYATANFTNIDPQMVFRDGDYCEYTAIPDAIFEAYLVARGLDDVANDGQAPTALIATETSINLDGANVADLTGIEAFTSLRNLNAEDNDLTIVDLSANTLLINVNLKENALSDINLTGLTALTDLDVEDNNLTAIDISTNINLEQLVLSRNANLASVDVSNNTELRTLEVNNCTNLPGITFGNNFFLSRLEANQSGLTSLDVRLLVRLSQIELDNTSIGSLALWNNSLLRDVSIQNTPISSLNMRNGNNTNLDTNDVFLQNNPNLFCVLVDDAAYSATNWTNVDAQMRFSDTYCTYTAVPDSNFEAALQGLGYDDISGDGQVPTALIFGVTSLNIASENISDLTGIEDFAALETLIANNNSITTGDFSDNTNLTQLNLEGNILASIDITANTNLEILNLSNAVFNNIDVSANTLLRELSIIGNTNLTSIDVSANTNLENLILSDNGLTDITLGSLTLLQTFSVQNNSLESLDLSAFPVLGQVDVSNNNLSTLDVRNGNNLGISSFNATGNPNLLCISVDNTNGFFLIAFVVDAQTSFSTMDYCNYTTIPDANFETELENLGLDDVSGDGQVPTVLIEGVTSLDVTGLTIADLTGIKDFIALETLNVSATALLTLDISDMTNLETFIANPAPSFLGAFDASNCTALQSLTLVDTAITQIDITGATSLEELNVHTTSLGSLDVSTNTALEVINAYQTLLLTVDVSNLSALREFRGYNSTISELDFTNNPALEIVDVSNASLTSLNIRNGNNTNITSFNATTNPSLTCILVDDADYSTTNWTNIDATASFTSTDYCRYTAIPGANFEFLLGIFNYDDIPNDGQVPTELIEVVTSLNISFFNINDITGIQDFAALESLNVSYTGITSLDVSGMLNLQTLDATSTTALTSLDVSSTPALTTITATNSNVSSIDLTDATALEEIDVSGTQITSLDVNTNMVLKRLEVDNTPLTDVNFGGVSTIEVLSIHDTDITSLDTSGLTALIELQAYNTPLFVSRLDLTTNTNLQILDVSNSGLIALDVRNGNNTAITTFNATAMPNLSCISVDDVTYSTNNWTNIDPTTIFSDTFCRYTQIPDANFEAALDDAGYDDITGDGQVPTAFIEVVTSLNVAGEDIADLTGIEDFAALTFLNAGSNQIVNLDLSSNILLEEFRAFRGDLETINTSNCLNLKIFNADLNNLISLDLSDNIALEEISINFNDLTSLDITNNVNLTNLNADSNPIGAIDISTNTLLERISLGNCGLTSIDVSNNVNLKDLSLGSNDISTIDLSNNTLLETIFMANCALTAIDFSNNLLLESISLRDNNLTTVVIPDLPNLTVLLIDENPNLSSLTLGVLPMLDELNASECALTTIETSHLSNLIRVNLADNQFASLDFSPNTALNRVYVENNDLNFLNVRNGNNTNFLDFDATNNPNLTCILVDDAAYSTTNWTDIDATASFTSTDYCDYTAIPDSAFETMLGNLGLDDIASDGQVPTELIEVVTTLDVSFSGSVLTDLTGIEAFAALEELDFDGQIVNTVDLSANTNLRVLSCVANGLSALDLTGLTQLEVLDAGVNLLESLDLSDNLNLTRLIVNDTRIRDLDLSQLTALTYLNCSVSNLRTLNVRNGNNTNITFFDTTNNQNLTCILVDDAAYSTANWTNIDATTNFTSTDYCRYTQIPDVNFEAELNALGLDDIAADGQVPTELIENLTALDVSNNNILDLTGIEDFTALLTLNIAQNNITSLDISNNTLLSNLIATGNNFTTLDTSANIPLEILIVDQMTSLTTLDFGNNPAIAFLNAEGCTNLTTVTFANNNSDLNFTNLKDTAISALDISGANNLQDLDISGTNVTNLDLSSNNNLQIFFAQDSALEAIDIRNGTNTDIIQFNTLNSPNLTCISVDDVAYSTTNWTNVDATVNFTTAGFCRYTAIPDSTFEMRLEGLGLDDISGDGQVPTALIEVVTSLDASYLFSPINDLTGIEDFTALEDLDISGNSINTIDLSANTNLRVLDCESNGLGALDLTGLTQLEVLNAGANLFNSLDFSDTPNLTRLTVYSTSITELDVSQLTSLTILDCSFNNLTALNVRNGNNTNFTSFDAVFNPNLTCILVDDAAYSTANWDNIDTTASFTSTDYCRYTQIPDTNFEAALDALGYDDIPGDGQVPTELIEAVTDLNVASNNISNMKGIEDFTALEFFYPFDNNLTSLDVSQNTNLQILLVADNNLTALDLSNNTALTFLNANNNTLSAIDLSANVNLQSLRINDNALTALDVSANPSLVRVTCENNQITSLDLSNNIVLTTIEVGGNDLMTLNVQNGNNTNVISFNALNNPNLSCITVDDVAYSDANWTNIDVQTVFSTTDCRYTQIPDANFEAALEDLGLDDISGDGQVPTALIEVENVLIIPNRSITDLTGIQDFTALQVLNIENNSITDLDISGMQNLIVLEAPNAITSSLDASNTPVLEEVNVQESDIATINLSGATSLVQLLVYRTNIASLDLTTNNSMTSLVAFEMPNLTSVDLTGAVLLDNIELYQTPLETLDLSSNISLKFVTVFQNNLSSLNLQNGNNTNITSFFATDNPNLTCILVDDAAYSTTNWTNIDATTSFSETYCRYTQIPDSTFEAYLGDIGRDDISGDGQVPTALVETITGLTITNEPIADLTGIEDFTAINNLTIIGANLTDVDFTQNTVLTRLTLSNSGVTSLNISANTALEFLNISESSMTSLDLSNNLLLNYFAFSDTTITSLNLTQNTALQFFLLGTSSNLTSLNLQNGNNTNMIQFSIAETPNLTCVLVDDAAYSEANWTFIPNTIFFNEVSCENIFDLNIKVYLQGAALNPNTGEENLMRDDLRAGGFIPTRSPYADMLTCASSVFDVTGDDAIVDWIWVELRDGINNRIINYSRSALLQRDGDIVDVDGVSPLTFETEFEDYHVAVKHRSHLGVITNSSILFSLQNTIDFTASGTGVYGSNSRTSSGMPSGVLGLWCGNANSDTVVQYSGTSPDTPAILSEVLNDPGNFLNFPTYSSTGYTTNDVNMDGMIQYSGTNPDTPFILQNILAHPGNFLGFSTYQIIEQLPENLLN
ncbi:MAG: hypothetical protein AAF611_06725 [Bacteroidota bacterium]